MDETVSTKEEVTAVALPIINGTYRIRSVGGGRLLAPIPVGNICWVGFGDANAEEAVKLSFNCDWIIERYPNSKPDAGEPGFMGAPKEPWYRIWNKFTGQILVVGGKPGKHLVPILWGAQEEFMGDKTLGTLQEMWRIIKFEGRRLRTGIRADDTSTWFMIQSVCTGQLLVLAIDEYIMQSFMEQIEVDPLKMGELAKKLGMYDFASTYGKWNQGLSENNPNQMWTLDSVIPAELLDIQLDRGVTSQQLTQSLTTEASEYRNDSDAEQEHTFTFSYEYSDSYSFSWENSLSIGVEVEVKAEFPGFGSASTKTTFENKLTVGREQTNTFTYSKTYEFPVKVPPHSIVKASMIVFKGSYDVGFTAKLRIGSEVREEKGTLHAVLGAGSTHYNVEQVKLDTHADIPHRGNGGKKSK